MNKNIKILSDVKNAIRYPYAFPGGYSKYLVMVDGEALSVEFAKENFKQIAYAQIHKLKDDWAVFGVDINWENENLICAHSNKLIECAYPAD